MQRKITVILKNHFGRKDYEPICEIAKLFLQIRHRGKSFKDDDLEIIRQIGFEVDIIR